MLNWKQRNPKITEETIINYEQQNKIKFPEDYRRFLLETNGGELEYIHFLTLDDELFDYTDIRFFFGLQTSEQVQLQGITNLDLENTTWHEQEVNWYDTMRMIAYGEQFHDGFLLVVKGSDTGTVYYVPDGYIEYGQKLADSFTNFLELIKYDTDPPVAD